MAAGFVSIFMDLVKSDVEIMQLLKSIDIRLSMLRTSSQNYTTVLDQWLILLHNDMKCYNSYHNSVMLVSNAFHKLYLFVKASVAGQSAKLDEFQALCKDN